jgi:hypothetical protein
MIHPKENPIIARFAEAKATVWRKYRYNHAVDE